LRLNISKVVLKTTAPTATPDVGMGRLFPGQDVKWALLGRARYFWVDPSKPVAGVILTQILPFVDPAIMKLYGQFGSGVYKAVSSA
jgi:hypothetical protein